ncbi:MAG: hypothetical protein BWX48_03256 [Verrucomicrobia bacterium ADurb.Bin006]|nr:MAG: hypothetical protein BWX48_03256 [Verrucomicrobia bacterium ADurb.Bin006]
MQGFIFGDSEGSLSPFKNSHPWAGGCVFWLQTQGFVK